MPRLPRETDPRKGSVPGGSGGRAFTAGTDPCGICPRWKRWPSVYGGDRPLRDLSPAAGHAWQAARVEPLVVEVVRGAVVEARHRVHVAVVRDGRCELSFGDPGLVTFFRSAAKPIQALPVVRARPDLDDVEIAIACASHLARPEQLEAVRRLLASAPATEDELECGPEPTRLEHNCSGKHAGFLALCRARGWTGAGYHLPEHPCQRELHAAVAAAAEVGPEAIPTATDGCGVPTFALSLQAMAHAFARLAVLDGGDRVQAAMRAYPDLIRGPLAADSELMRLDGRWVAKIGAEGLLCAVADGVGVALKAEDGDLRAIRPALARLLGALGFESGEIGVVVLENSRGEAVGELRVA
jgi:L-asparaginase II